MFRPVSSQFNFPEIESRILEFWKKNHIFQRSIDIRAASKPFVFYEGPPTANGRPGVHHIQSRTFKDFVCRYKAMKGYKVDRKAGWDTHGLPVEIEVEKELGLDGKDQIEEYGIEKFNAQCKLSVFKYEREWREMTQRIGFWLDMDNPYITCTNDYIESVWWILKKLWEAGLIYRGHKILPYCPRCGTPLSSHEVAQGYEEVEDPSIFVKLKVLEEENTYFLIWTTTPWTLISNVAIAVHPQCDYLRIRQGEEHLILAENRLKVIEGDYEVEQGFPGSELKSKRYEPLFNFCQPDKPAFFVTLADFVATDEGTGIVHIAPAFGEDDHQLGQEYGLPILQPVDGRGRFTPQVETWKGRFVKDADREIIKDLAWRNLLYKEERVRHNYPHCWRCNFPLLYYARKSWYIKTTAFKDRLIANNNRIDWYPEEVGKGRFGDWLENNVDWTLSRDRYWGTPLNIWICSSCGQEHSVGSVDELRRLGREVPFELDLHRPFVDSIRLKCPHCGGEMARTPEVIDAWFDSGSMALAQWHYPFENREAFEENFPADFISEGIDQTRGWFYSLLTISTFLFDQPCFKSVLVTELVLDRDGQKMSKSRGNIVDPWDILNQQGADPLRWYLMTVSPPWLPTRFDQAGVTEVTRKFLGTLVNIYSFFAMYANIDKFDPRAVNVDIRRRPEIDRWILSRLNSLIRVVDGYVERYELSKAAKRIEGFVVDDLSNWYVRRCRRRFWKSELGEDKDAAYSTLYQVLLTLTKLIAPFAPFIAEEIYQNLLGSVSENAPESVHLCDYPTCDRSLVDIGLEDRMDLVKRIVFLGRSVRNKAKIKARQPLAKVLIAGLGERSKQKMVGMRELIIDELNVKQIAFVDDVEQLMELAVKPNFKALGPRLGKRAQAVAEKIGSLSTEELGKLKRGNKCTVEVEGYKLEILPSDVEIVEKERENYPTEADELYAVALDIHLTKELLNEGFAREFVNRVQSMRKQAGFEVTDRINIYYQATERLKKALTVLEGYIREETLALYLGEGNRKGELCQEWDVNGERAAIAVERRGPDTD